MSTTVVIQRRVLGLLGAVLLTCTGTAVQAQAPAASAAAAAEGRSYSPGPFEGLQIEGSATVLLVQGDSDQVFVAGDAQAQKALALDLRGNTLTVRSIGDWKFWRTQRLQLTVTVRQLSWLAISGAAEVNAPGPLVVNRLAVHISGSGQVRADQLRTEQLDFNVSGSGDGRFAGSAGQLGVQISGRGSFNGEQLAAQRARVGISGLGDARLWAVQELALNVAGVGDVAYWGNPPVVRRSVSGRANLTDLGPRPGVPAGPTAPATPATPPPPAVPAAALTPR